MKKLFLTLFLLFIMIPKVNATDLAPSASSVIVIEPTTGEIIYERNSNERRHPASMTKIMTMLLTLEAIEKGNISWEEIVTVSENASSMGGSQILLETGEQMSVYDLFKGLAVASGNDAAVALAEKIAGSEEEFVNMMNERAKQLGLTNTNFKNCHGLDDPNHYSSAYDMSMMAKELVKHEKVFEFTSIYEDYLRKNTNRSFWLVNTNKLVKFYPGVDGLKTGYTKEAGYCITATANKNDMRIITVVMGEPDTKTRNSEVSSIFDYVYAQYGINKIVDENEIVDEVTVEKGKKEKVNIISKENVVDLYKKSDGVKDISYEVNINKLIAPIKKGDVVGNIKLSDGRIIELTVEEDIKKANIFEILYRNFINVIN
ncbi:MAG: D-alanyl-D-alanine carboxypeptidase [Firmicutes bacterium]|nr:D-alanyl-D-alanine carboxypeptidase [Bacillota bacterium]